jgi:hypothetical protein
MQTVNQFGITTDREFQTRLLYSGDESMLVAEPPLAATNAYLAHVSIANPSAAGVVERRGSEFGVTFVVTPIN